MENLTNDISKLCRACRNESKHMLSLFETVGNMDHSPRIDEMLMACTSIQIRLGDGLPAVICPPCADLLRASYMFKRKCEATDNDLKEYIRNAAIEGNVKQELLQSVNTELTSNLLDDISSVIISDVNNCPPDACVKSDPDSQHDTSLSKDFIEILDNNQMLLTCRTCFKSFTTLDGLKCHKRLHTGGLFECKVCGKEYTRQNHLQRHEATHGRRKVHVCKICNKTLTRFEHLKRHLVTHLKEKPFSCKTCNRGFNRAEHLANHTVRCKGDRVHICDICNKGFNREDSLEVHRKLHENKQPALPTLENLDNIEEHYYEIDCDGSSMLSDLSDTEDGDDKRDCFEPQVSVTETGEHQLEVSSKDSESRDQSVQLVENIQREQNMQANKTELTEQEWNHRNEDIDNAEKEEDTEKNESLSENMKDCQNNVIETNSGTEIEMELAADDNLETKEELSENPEENIAVAAEQNPNLFEPDEPELQEDSDSCHSEYTPLKTFKRPKRKRGRPRKHPIVPKPTGRPRGRPPGSGKIKKEKEETGENGDYQCPSCQKKFTTLVLLEKHAIKHEGLKIHSCSVCGKKFARMNHLKRHMMSHSKLKPYVCEICTKRFNRRDHLSTHMKLHSRTQEFECDICRSPFGRADHLAKHKASKHNIGEMIVLEKKYKCEICFKGFTTEKYRDVHMKGHTGDKSHKCKTCEKTFISKSHLTEHMKFHNENSKKFLCSECGQRFIRNDYLVIHMRRHRGEKPFKCKFCGKGFPRTTDLTVHERYHTGEKTHLCTICGRGFGRAYNLTVHMRTHTGEKPYQCTYCDAAFAQGNDLKAHIRRHTGERFQCDLCTDSFLMGYLLTQHKRTVHGLNVVSNIRRLKPVQKLENSDSNPDEPPPVTIQLPPPVIPVNMLNAQLQAQLAVAQLQNQLGDPCTLKFEPI